MKGAAATLALACLLASMVACEGTPEPVRGLAVVEPPPDLGARALAHTATVVGFGPRHPGTPGWHRQIAYIQQQLRDLGLAVRVDRWTDPRERLALANVIATLPGQSRQRIVLACHHDTKCCSGHGDPAHNFEFVGANDGGSGVGLLLALADELRRSAPHAATYEFVFFDGEESLDFDWTEARALFGSRRYVAEERKPGRGRHWTEPIRAMVLLDMVGARDLQLDDDTNSHEGLRAILRAAARACGEEHRFLRRRNVVSDDHLPFLAAGIPAAVLIDLADNPQWHTPQDTLDHLDAASLHAVGRLVLTALPAIERRFLAAPEKR